MDKWKVIIIVLLLAGLGGYGFYQQNASQAPPPPDPNVAKNEPLPNEKIIKRKGQAPPAWDIPANLWVNTKAPIPLSSLKGSVALLEFWRIGCPHCERAAPFLNQLYNQYKTKGLKMVTIHTPGSPAPENPENNWTTVRQTIKDWGITYPVAYDEGGKLFQKVYGGDRYPTAILLDREGKIQFVETGMDSPEQKQQLVSNIDKLLAAKPSSKPDTSAP
jgi:thiol-disulfide isomerase/thioredoxin